MASRLGIFYKNFSAWKGISHIGLGVAALANSQILKGEGIETTVFPVRHNIDIVQSINSYRQETGNSLTHVVISAPWISTRDMVAIVSHFNMIQFVVASHSNVGFLQADPAGIHLLRDYVELCQKYDNFTVGGNNAKFVNWLREVYGEHTVLLPNMYPIQSNIFDHVTKGLGRVFKKKEPPVLKIGSFGAIRPLKNQLTAAAASLVIAHRLNIPVEFHISAGREEGGGSIVLSAIQQMTQDMPNFKLVLDGWRGWMEFCELAGEMDLLIHPSYTESFNIATADGVSRGVPTVGSTAIDWLPRSWQADSDNAIEIAEVGIRLLKEGASEGIEALKDHNEMGLKYWKTFLNS